MDEDMMGMEIAPVMDPQQMGGMPPQGMQPQGMMMPDQQMMQGDSSSPKFT
jgi:hypothetical protein